MSKKLENDALEFVREKKFADAVKIYSQLINGDSGDKTRYLCERGECYMRLRDFKAALADGLEAKSKNSSSIMACVLCGKASAELEEYTNSLNYFRDGLKLDPQDKIIIQELKSLQSKIVKDQKSQIGEDSTYSAVSLCSQSIYPGDDQLLVMEKQILEKKYKILDDPAYRAPSTVKKNPEMEAQLVQAAYECLTGEDNEKALLLVSKAVDMDANNTFYRMFRAQVYFNMKKWAKVMQDYWVIPKPQRKAEVWKQGGKALLELWLPVLSEFWFRKATQLSGGKDEEAAILFQKVRVKRLYDPLTDDQDVFVDFRQFGRSIYAKKDIKKGDLVLKDFPMVFAQSIESRHVPACANCTRSLLTPQIYFKHTFKTMPRDCVDLIQEFWPKVDQVWCQHCNRECYCSEICRREAWDVYHKVLCPHNNPAAHKLYDLCERDGYGYTEAGDWVEIWGGHFSPMILAKIWAITIIQAKTQMEESGLTKPTLEQWARAKAPFRRFIAYGRVLAVERLPHALPLFQAVFSQSDTTLFYNITEDEFNGRFYQAACNLQCVSPSITPYHKFIHNIKEDNRSIGIIKYLQDSPPEAEFAALCPLHACTNHSCMNNAEVSDLQVNERPAIQMIASRDIKKDEEVFITYIDTTMPKLLRKAWLYKSFNFWCQCQRCSFEGEQATECSNCLKTAPEDKKFPACSKCKAAWYCCKECQKSHWKKGHKICCSIPHSIVSPTVLYNP